MRFTVECVCEDSANFEDADGDGCSAYSQGSSKHSRCADVLHPTDTAARVACPLACGACEPDLCASSPCMNGGTCTQRADSATCTPSDLADRVAAVARECCDEPTEDCSAYSVVMLPLCLGLCRIIVHGLEQVAASRRAATAAARQCCCHTTSTAARPCRPSRGRERCDNSSPCPRLRLSLSLSLSLCFIPCL